MLFVNVSCPMARAKRTEDKPVNILVSLNNMWCFTLRAFNKANSSESHNKINELSVKR
jgi:hypothetical protein